MTAFVPTNVISITDGQIFLETDLFNAGIRPAINAGISVSRVGGAAQTKIMKRRDTGGGVRLALAQYRELAAFAQFASDLDEATRKQLERGRMVTELMKQPQYQPLQVWEMALTLFGVNNGYFDDIDVKKALAAERSMRDYLKSKYADLVNRMETTKDLSEGRRSGAARSDQGLEEERYLLSGRLARPSRRHAGTLKASHARHQRDPGQDPECAEHPQDHQGHGDGRRLEDAQGAGAHAHGAPVRREDPQRRRAHLARQPGVPPSVSGRARHRQARRHHRDHDRQGSVRGAEYQRPAPGA